MEVSKFNSDHKQIIRKKWAKPLLKFLSEDLEKQLFYLGLPDVEALDIVEWLDYIDSVFAFQCREYPLASNPEQSRDKVVLLETKLRELERRQKIANFDVFDGYIEEVVLRGYDNSPTVKEYEQQDVITLYNLDFCGQVTSPIEFVDKNGNLRKAFKFNAVDRLLEFQRKIDVSDKKFITFLTLHCSYDGKEFSDFISNPHNTDLQKYIDQVKSLSKGKKAPYLVKAFVYSQLITFFTRANFLPEFLPTIYYEGDNGHKLLFFTIIGNQVEASSGSPAPLTSLNNLLNCPFLTINEKEEIEICEALKLTNDIELKGDLSSLAIFKKSKTFKTKWVKKDE